MRPGAKGPEVAILRKRLAAEGDLDPAKVGDPPYSEAWDADITAAVKRFQRRMGLRQTGIVAGDTLKELNVPAVVRLRALASSAARIAPAKFDFTRRYVVVNLAATEAQAVQDGKVAARYPVIAGAKLHQSPDISVHIGAIELNPNWTVPVSIIKKEIIPRMRKDPGYLARARIRILDAKGNEIDPRTVDWSNDRAAVYTFRQDAGTFDALGRILIRMPNKEAVYMHDTDSHALFARDYRFLSHGCVRVNGVFDLAAWILAKAPGHWTAAALEAEMNRGKFESIPVREFMPVIWVYMTGWADPDGTVNFRDDVYSRDTVTDAPPLVDPNAVAIAPLPPQGAAPPAVAPATH
ncbi:MAG: L,D-transpeptidase family protein [Hyphomicrobiales bacterium]|nr:L,D-transpeptidase family protein [Hyphomicrobiales bacterium]